FSTLGSMVTGLTLNADGTYTYVPATNFVGTVSQKYKVCDSGSPVACDTATLVITVLEPVTNPPLVVIPPIVTEQDKPATVCGTIDDPDLGDTHTVTICGTPTKGSIGTPTVDNSTHKICLTFTPTVGQTGNDQVCLIVCDQTGKCDTVNVPIVITPALPPVVSPQPPVVVVTPIVTPQDSTTTTCMPILDPNGTGTNTFTICGAAKNGTANPVTTTGGQLCVTYKPNAGFIGRDSLCVIVCDGSNLCDTVMIPITVYPQVVPGTQQPPVVVLPPIVTKPETPITICGPVNDPNVGDSHTVSLCNTPTKGTVSGISVNNTTHQLCLTYTPMAGETGNDKLCVTVCDQTNKCTTVEVPVTILPPVPNEKPLATDDITQTPQDKPVSGNVLPNDLDPEGGVLTVSTTPT
ncbi:Ig-like domain-containing protein, partial [Runella salmonicolor]